MSSFCATVTIMSKLAKKQTKTKNPKSSKRKLFSQKAFIIGGILGGPIAPIYFFYKNFKNQGNKYAARLSLILGPVIVVAFVILLTVIEDAIFKKGMSRPMIIGLNLALVAGFYFALQDKKVRAHAASGGKFYNPVGIVLISMVLTVALVLGFIKAVIMVTDSDITVWEALSLSRSNYDDDAYWAKSDEIHSNDLRALRVFSLSEEATDEEFITGLENSLVLYNRNLKLIKEIEAMKNLPTLLKKENASARRYTEIRLEMHPLMIKAVKENTTAYDAKIEALLDELDQYQEDEAVDNNDNTFDTEISND
jgi:hypothetical protein